MMGILLLIFFFAFCIYVVAKDDAPLVDDSNGPSDVQDYVKWAEENDREWK